MFWDSSAIVPLLVFQPRSKEQIKLLGGDSTQLVGWNTHCECFSALARLEREGGLSLSGFQVAHGRLVSLAKSWQVIIPSDGLILETKRVLRTHILRCADALQLASAILGSDKEPSTLKFVCLD